MDKKYGGYTAAELRELAARSRNVDASIDEISGDSGASGRITRDLLDEVDTLREAAKGAAVIANTAGAEIRDLRAALSAPAEATTDESIERMLFDFDRDLIALDDAVRTCNYGWRDAVRARLNSAYKSAVAMWRTAEATPTREPPIIEESREAANPDQQWELFWKEICTQPDGSINVEQIKKELADYSMLLSWVPRVYEHVTGGQCSRVNTWPSVVIALHDDHVSELVDDALRDERGDGAEATQAVAEMARWISVADRMPAKDGWYAVKVSDPHDVGWDTSVWWRAQFVHGDWDSASPIEDGQPVTHWMEISMDAAATQAPVADAARADELASMTRMFHAACVDLGAINEALGLDPDDGGAEPILDAIAELKRERAAIEHRTLTDDEIDEIANDGCRNAAGGIYATKVYEFARAISQATATAPAQQAVTPDLAERALLAAAAWANSDTPVAEALAYRTGFVAGAQQAITKEYGE